MKHINMVPAWRWLTLSAGLMLAACGGGGDGGQTSDNGVVAPSGDTNTVPVTALADSQALVAYMASLPPDDSLEPLTVSAVVPPVSDTDEPVAL